MKTQWTVRSRILGIYVIAAFVVLLIPIAYTFLFSFPFSGSQRFG